MMFCWRCDLDTNSMTADEDKAAESAVDALSAETYKVMKPLDASDVAVTLTVNKQKQRHRHNFMGTASRFTPLSEMRVDYSACHINVTIKKQYKYFILTICF